MALNANDLNPGTSYTTSYTTEVAGQKISLLDTPGFCDSKLATYHILDDIIPKFDQLAQDTKFQTRGVIFLHDINGIRFDESQLKMLGILEAICGAKCMANVIVGTTKWSDESSRPEDFANQANSEQEYLSKRWGRVHKTVRVPRDDRAVAVEIIKALLELGPITLRAQAEMQYQNPQPGLTGNTAAGRLALGDCGEEIKEIRRGLERDMTELKAGQEQLKGDQKKLAEDIENFTGCATTFAEVMEGLTELAAGNSKEGVGLTEKMRGLQGELGDKAVALEEQIKALAAQEQKAPADPPTVIKETQMGTDETTPLLPSDGGGYGKNRAKPGLFRRFLTWIQKKWSELKAKFGKLCSRQKATPMSAHGPFASGDEKSGYRPMYT